MSLKCMLWVFESSQSTGSDRLVLLALADHADDETWKCWPSVPRIAHKAKVSERTVQRSIKTLEKIGELAVEDRGNEHRPNLYEVNPGRRRQSDTLPGGGGDNDDDGGASMSSKGDTGDVKGDTGDTPNPKNPHESSEEPSTSNGSASDGGNPDVERLCTLLADLIEVNGSKRPNVTKAWRVACDRLMRLDERTPEQIERAIRWCQADDFWYRNILSMPKLREKYDRLRLAAKSGPPRAGAGSSRFDDATKQALDDLRSDQ